MRVVGVAVLLASCSSKPTEPKPQVAEPKPAKSSVPYSAPCPTAIDHGYPWAHELFPGCPPPQQPTFGFRCDGTCPKLCRVRHPLTKRTFSIEYDAAGRFIAARDNDKDVVSSCAYDTAGRMTSCTGFYGRATIERDERGRIVRVADDAEGSLTRISYDDPVPEYARRPGLTYSGRIKEVQKSPTALIYLEYSSDGRLESERDGPRILYAYHYDAAGRVELIEEEPPPPGTTLGERARYERDVLHKGVRRYKYDAAGRLAESTAEGSNDKYTYDAKGRLAEFRGEEGGKEVEIEVFDYCD